MTKELKHGQFKVTTKSFLVDGKSSSITTEPSQTESKKLPQKTMSFDEHIVNHLTQEELAENWRLVLPKKNNKILHEYNVYLSQLPFYLWNKLKLKYNLNKTTEYMKVKDHIYTYDVRQSSYDDMVLELGRETMKKSVNMDKVATLYSELSKYRVKGWPMIRAKQMLHSK